MLVKLLKGEKIPYANELLAPLITRANLDKTCQLNDKVDQLLGGAQSRGSQFPKVSMNSWA